MGPPAADAAASPAPAPAAPELILAPGEPHPLIEAFLADQSPGVEVPRAVAEDDEMWRYSLLLHHGHREQALLDYFRSGLAAARAFEQILIWRFGPGGPSRLLDFASGWGRVTRHLLAGRPAEGLWVSDISAEALEFQRRHLGVGVVPSARRPEELTLPHPFDAVLVASLFTHLPRSTFVPWLRRLFAALAPGGVLVVSTHGDLTLPEGEEMPADGFWFEEYSEIETLQPGEYGRTLVTGDFVRGALAQAAGGPWPCLHLPRGLWHLQDLWVIPRDPRADLSGLAFDGGPDGRIYGYRIEGSRRLWLAGWAAHHTRPERPVEVVVTLGGETVQRCAATGERPDVARRFRNPALLRSGWLGRCEPPAGGPLEMALPISVKAVDREGGEMVLYQGTVEGLVARLDQEQLRHRLAEVEHELHRADEYLKLDAYRLEILQARLAAVEASRFWKIRNAWFRLKRTLGLTKPGE